MRGDHKNKAHNLGDLKRALKSVQVTLLLKKDLLGDHSDTADSYQKQGVIDHALCYHK